MSLPTLDELAAAERFLGKRFGFAVLRREVLASALDEARRLVREEDEEPAALFYALASRARALRAAWPVLPDVLATTMASRRWPSWKVDRGALRSLRVRVASRSASYDEVARFFTARVQ